GDTNGIMDVFVHNNVTGATERVSYLPNGAQIESTNTWAGGAQEPEISADGRYVTFVSDSKVYLRDRVLDTTEQISASGNSTSAFGYASVSADGSKVLFFGSGRNLVSPALPACTNLNGCQWAFLRDRTLGTTT